MQITHLLPSDKTMETCTKIEYLVYVSSIAFYLDTYLVKFKSITLLSVNLSWLKNNVELGDCFLLISVFLFLIMIIVPLIRVAGSSSMLLLDKFIDIKAEMKSSNYVRSYIVREYAIRENNLPAYREFECAKEEQENRERSTKLCISLAILIAFNYAFGTNQLPTLIKSIWTSIYSDHLPWYLTPLRLIVSILLFGIIVLAARLIFFHEDEDYIYISDSELLKKITKRI